MNSHSWIIETLIDIGSYAEKNNLTNTGEEVNLLIFKLCAEPELASPLCQGSPNVHYITRSY